jgi:WD40 repeat protein
MVALAIGVLITVFGTSTSRQPPHVSTSSRSITITPPPPLMPTQIVVWTDNFKMEVVSSRTGQLVRTLASGVAEIRGLPHLAASPAGLVYFDQASGTTENIMSVPVTGGPVATVAQGWKPAISPNGQLLAYESYTDLTNAPESVVVLNLKSGGQRTWTLATNQEDISDLTWSPNGSSLAVTFTVPKSGGSTLAVNTVVIDTTTAGRTIDSAQRIALPDGVQWGGYLDRQTGVGVIVSSNPLDTSHRIRIVRVATSGGRILGPLTTLPRQLSVANVFDGTEGTIQSDPSGHFLLIAAGEGLYRWGAGFSQPPVPIEANALRAAWVPAS